MVQHKEVPHTLRCSPKPVTGTHACPASAHASQVVRRCVVDHILEVHSVWCICGSCLISVELITTCSLAVALCTACVPALPYLHATCAPL